MAKVGYRFPSRPAEERFWEYTDRQGPGECWPWKATRSPRGYGRFSLDGQTVVQAHRYAYELLIGPIPAGLQLDHLCRNRACVNPAHLEPVTGRVNLLRGISPIAQNAAKTACPKGHPYTQTRTRGRRCRTCDAAANVEYRSRHGIEVNARKRERLLALADKLAHRDPSDSGGTA